MTEQEIKKLQTDLKVVSNDYDQLLTDYKKLKTEHEALKAKLKYSEENNHDLREQIDWLEENYVG